MLWLYIIVGILLLVPILLQILLIGPVFQALIRGMVGRFLSLGFRGPGFLMPFLHFRARRFRFMIHGRADSDRVFFSADRVRFRLDPFFLLLGKLRIVGLQLYNPYLEYFNRVESFEKNRYLPPRHRLELKNLSIHNGTVYVKDETMTPVYRLEIGRIELENCDMDVGTPVDLFFRAERGQAGIGSGRIEIGNSSGQGYIRLWGVTWAEIASMEDLPVPLPLLKSKLALIAYHTGGVHGRHVQGEVGYSTAGVDQELPGSKDGRYAVPFEFDLNWEDYRLTLDLGLQKLIGNIFSGAKPNWLSSGFVLSGRSVFELLRKQEKAEGD